MVDLVDLEDHAVANVVTDDLELPPFDQMGHVVARAGEEVVEADDLVTCREQALTQVRAEKPRATRNQYSFRHGSLRRARLCHRGSSAARRGAFSGGGRAL